MVNRKIIAIYVGQLYFSPDKLHTWDEKNLNTGGIGGSEVWAIELASKLESDSIHCMVYADCDTWHFAESGVEYIPYRNFNISAKFNHFDMFISSRRMDEVPYACINADVKVLMFHDPFLIHSYNEDTFDFFDYFMYQSEYQKRLLLENYPALENKNWIRTFQALDSNLYAGDCIKKNKMLWSSHKIRGSKFLIERVLPIIRKSVPDFEIDVCGYANDMDDEYFNAEGVNVLGNIEKSELIRIQKECKIWIYPYTGWFENGRINDETFCITAIENALAGNAIIVPDRGCFASTLQGYNGFTGTEVFGDYEEIGEESYDEYANKLAEQAIKMLTSENYRQPIADNANEICLKYDWAGAAKTFKQLLPSIEIEKKHNLILLTALVRPENLPIIANSIVSAFKDKNINVCWAINHDVLKSEQEATPYLRQIADTCKENGITVFYSISKLNPNEKYYGGYLLNDPLKAVKNYFMKDCDPWVYILDDDNTISNIFGNEICDIFSFADEKERDIILTNMLRENGEYITAHEHTVDVCCHLYWKTSLMIPFEYTPDSSQYIYKYSMLEKLGFYEYVPNFDKKLYYETIRLFRDKILTQFEYDNANGNCVHKWLTTHNSITPKYMLNNILAEMSTGRKSNCRLMITTEHFGNRLISIDSADAIEIINKNINDETYGK